MRTIAFDVDSTLLLYGHEVTPEVYATLPSVFISSGISGTYVSTREYKVHTKHVEAVKQVKAEGAKVIVWSAGGEEWARQAVEALQLQDYVDVIIAKPDAFYDDLPSSEFLPNISRRYIKYGD